MDHRATHDTEHNLNIILNFTNMSNDFLLINSIVQPEERVIKDVVGLDVFSFSGYTDLRFYR